MTENFPTLSLAEIDKLNQIIFERHPDAEAEALAASIFLQTVALDGFTKAHRELVAARIATRKPKDFYEAYRNELHEIAALEDEERKRESI